MATLEGLLASLLNPNPGVQRAGLLGPNAMAQTGLGPEQLARYHQMSGMGGQAMPQAAPPAPSMPSQAPAPDQMQTASTAPARSSFGLGGLGDAIGGLFNPKGANKNRTVQLLMQEGLDEGAATLVAGNKAALGQYLSKRAFGEPSEFAQRSQVAQQYGLQGDEAKSFILTGDLPKKDDRNLMDVGKGRIYDADSGKWIIAPDMGTDAPTVQTFFDDKTGQEYKAQWNPQAGKWEPIGGQKTPKDGITVTSPDGTTMTIGGTGAGQKLTEGQSKDVAHWTQGMDANERLVGLEGELTNFVQKNVGSLPMGVGNYLRTPEYQQAQQAAERFLTSVLRKETGAAVTKEEWERYTPMFLPVPGDDPATLQQKRRAREVALMAIKSGLGTAEAVAEANRIRLGAPEGQQLTPQPSPERFAPDVIPGQGGSLGGWTDMGNGVRIRRKQ